MSAASEKGRSLEQYVAKLLQKKLGARIERDRRSGAGTHQKMDLADWYRDIPLDIECKNHQAVKIKEWMRQAKAGASFRQVPTVVFQADDDVLAVLPFGDLVDLLAEIKQGEGRVKELERPVPVAGIEKVVDTKRSRGLATCRNGHLLSPGATKCLMKGCPHSSSYKPKKEKKS